MRRLWFAWVLCLGPVGQVGLGAGPEAFERLTFHAAAKPLAEGAAVADWPRFLGPTDDGRTPETRLLKEFSADGPGKVWEVARGDGYAAPAIAGGRLVLFHRLDGKETIECLDAETGRRHWHFCYPVEYQDRFNYSPGPRNGPVIAGGEVYTFGVTGMLHCLRLGDGSVVWKRDVRAEYGVPDNFFGLGSSPLVYGGLLILNAGGSGGRSVIAFDRGTGEEAWCASSDWGNSYASPIVARLHGSDRVMVFAGAESEPPTGGLLCIDPKTGRVDGAFPWRAKIVYSVNASTPVAVGEDAVFISESYTRGGALVRFSERFEPSQAWANPRFGMHFITPVLKDGHLYGIDGQHQGEAKLACVDAATGEERWRDPMTWEIPFGGETKRIGVCRGNLIWADGAFLCLGELGSLLWLDLSPAGCRVISRAQPFIASQTWTPPAISRGLLYLVQNARDALSGAGPRLLCLDLRAR